MFICKHTHAHTSDKCERVHRVALVPLSLTHHEAVIDVYSFFLHGPFCFLCPRPWLQLVRVLYTVTGTFIPKGSATLHFCCYYSFPLTFIIRHGRAKGQPRESPGSRESSLAPLYGNNHISSWWLHVHPSQWGNALPFCAVHWCEEP